MLQQVCDRAFAAQPFAAAWASLHDPASGFFEPVAFPSSLAPFRQLVRSLLLASNSGEYSPTRRALDSGTAQFVDRMRDLPWPAAAQPLISLFRIGGVAALPLRRSGEVAGALTLYVAEPEYFDADSRRALVSISRRISSALDAIDANRQLNHALARLSAREAQFRALVEQSLTGIYMIEDGRFTYVNPRLCEILGHSAEALLQMGPHEVTLEEDRALVDAQLRRRQSGELAAARYEFRIRRPSGEIRHVGVHGSVATIDGRRVIIGVLQDITARVQAEQLAATQLGRLSNAMHGTVGAVSRMVELRDPYTAGHESRVAALMHEIGRTMDFATDRQQGLAVIGGLHDIGKIAVPAEILVKPSKLTGAEFDLIKEHPLRGSEILAGLEFPWPVAQATLQHHERIDGSGYPHGLKGKDILIEARVLAVADTVEAMASHRPYRAGLGIDIALAEIERGRGSAYDADVADACLALFREKGYRLPA